MHRVIRRIAGLLAWTRLELGEAAFTLSRPNGLNLGRKEFASIRSKIREWVSPLNPL
jgi:hypothetical protein